MRNGRSCFEILPLPPGVEDPENIGGHLPNPSKSLGCPPFFIFRDIIVLFTKNCYLDSFVYIILRQNSIAS